jgi:DHA3 family macrolide efflux protein-like MFS transporter
MLFGKGIGVTAYWLVGIKGAILLDSISFLISFLLVRSCVIPESVRLPNGKQQVKSIDLKFIFNDYVRGLKYIWNHHFLRCLVSGYFVFGIFQAFLAIMPILYLKYKLAPHSYEQMAIIEGIVIGAGILLGSSFLTSISHKIKPMKIIVIGWVVTGALSASMGFVSTNQGFFILLFLCTFFVPFISMGVGGLLPVIVDPKFMGRVRGSIQPFGMMTTVLTFVMISVLFPNHISIESIFWFVGAVMLMTGFAYRMILPRFKGNENKMEEVA